MMKKTAPFRLKQFIVRQNNCAMKVGTDAILLGAWASVARPENILDIGTGTGIIALMLGQRYPQATVDAVESDALACQQASDNFEKSPWPDRLTAHCCDIQNFVSERHYDLIVCNPPYFQQSLKPTATARRMARHDETLSSIDLVNSVDRLLTADGRFSVIEPSSQSEDFIAVAAEQHLYCMQRCYVRPTPNHEPKRVLMEFTRQANTTVDETEIVIESSRHIYTPEYAALAKDFLLKL